MSGRCLKNLPDTEDGQRLPAVLEQAAECAGWRTPLPAGRACGIACGLDVNTASEEVAEVSVENGQARVHRTSVAVDPGMVINPQGAKMQAEGSVVMGLIRTPIESFAKTMNVRAERE
ncbi:hypothetical protein DESA109040_09930 [Deinococcus saxicola]|uniref:molybdopterin cofactor-binding domain-containing protein n=1 Tax=Deinococcus saxicola TaxID=249406 RepID=UPI0039F08FF7